MKMRFLFLGVWLISLKSFGLDTPPQLLRVCLDNNTSVATVYWKGAPDPCNSFKSYFVYSSENAGPWKLEAKINNINISSLPVFLQDMNSVWRFKITAHSACNGIDSFTSNELGIDQSKPPLLELDSVSFDLNSQNLAAGWKSSPAPDNKGYRIYQYNNSVNNMIQDLSATAVVLPGFNRFNPADLTLATFDSCNLFSPISNPQRAVYLSGSIDTCQKTIQLNWTPYQGWSNTNQFLYVSVNGNGFKKHPGFNLFQKVNAQYANIKLGDSLCFIIRTEETLLKKTSSSNRLCFFTRALKPPAFTYVHEVTVENESHIKITFESDFKANTDSVIVEKAALNSGSYYAIHRTLFNALAPKTVLQDNLSNFNTGAFSYRIKTFDKCLNLQNTSNTGTSIFLSKPVYANKSYTFQWNPYSAWEKGIASQQIEYSFDRFTWNSLQILPSSQNIFTFDNQVPVSDSVCFRVKATETTNSFGSSAESLSNVQCVYVVKDFYFPQTINPNSHNNTFKIYGSGLDRSRQKLEIFNRWGEKIFESTDLESGWDARTDGQLVEMGSYVFKASFYDQLNNYHLKTGSILIIR